MLHPSDPIAVVAPSHAFDTARLESGLALARAAGLSLVELPDLLQPHRYFAATDDHRGAQLVEALTAERFGGVWMVRGGSGLTRLLPRLEGVRLRSDRPVLGFSDGTALFAALHRAGAGPLVHAPVLHSLANTIPEDREALWALLRGDRDRPWPAEIWIPGEAEGWLAGGNLCVLAALCGTPWQLDARGAILMLEDIGEAPYALDRMLQQLVSAGVFDGVAGVGVGELVDCRVPAHCDWTLRDVFVEHLEPLGVPVLAGLPFGHGPRNRPFLWGASAQIRGNTLSWEPAGPMRIT